MIRLKLKKDNEYWCLKPTTQIVLAGFGYEIEPLIVPLQVVLALEADLVASKSLSQLHDDVEQQLAELLATVIDVDDEILEATARACRPNEFLLVDESKRGDQLRLGLVLNYAHIVSVGRGAHCVEAPLEHLARHFAHLRELPQQRGVHPPVVVAFERPQDQTVAQIYAPLYHTKVSLLSRIVLKAEQG